MNEGRREQTRMKKKDLERTCPSGAIPADVESLFLFLSWDGGARLCCCLAPVTSTTSPFNPRLSRKSQRCTRQTLAPQMASQLQAQEHIWSKTPQ
ncbi:hypothetical protein ANANG_G00122690, partial [Anguilla anguilla]